MKFDISASLIVLRLAHYSVILWSYQPNENLLKLTDIGYEIVLYGIICTIHLRSFWQQSLLENSRHPLNSADSLLHLKKILFWANYINLGGFMTITDTHPHFQKNFRNLPWGLLFVTDSLSAKSINIFSNLPPYSILILLIKLYIFLFLFLKINFLMLFILMKLFLLKKYHYKSYYKIIFFFFLSTRRS